MKLHRLFVLASGVVAVGGVSGCAEEDSASQTEDFAKAKAPVKFEVAGDIAGATRSSLADAELSLQEACDRWATTLRELAAPAEVLEVDCGTSRSLQGGASVQLAAEARATVVAKLPGGLSPVAITPGEILSKESTQADEAVINWVDTCEASLRRAKQTYGNRLLAGSCGTLNATWIAGSSTGYRSTPTLWVAPSDGTLISMVGFAQGAGNSEFAAHTAWRASCDAWLARVADTSGADRVGPHGCGAPRTVAAGSYWELESDPTVDINVNLVAETEAASETFQATGSTSSKNPIAKATAIEACEVLLAARKEELGGRFLSGSCGALRALISGYTFQYEATGTVWSGDLAPQEEPSPDDVTPIEPSPEGPDPNQSEPGADCMARCLTMMETCSAGPAQQTCEWICENTPTEGELSCAEQVACENVSDWFNVCGLGG